MNEQRNEKIHKAMYDLHWAIYRDSLGFIKKALFELFQEQLESSENRSEIKQYISELEKVRDNLESSLKDAGMTRSSLIRSFGCSGECTNK